MFGHFITLAFGHFKTHGTNGPLQRGFPAGFTRIYINSPVQYRHDLVHITVCRRSAQSLLPVCWQWWQELQPTELLAATGAGERCVDFRRQALEMEIVLARVANDDHLFAEAGTLALATGTERV